MNSRRLVVNASPIISLAKIGHADLLLALSEELVVPRGVCEEIMAHHNGADPAIAWLRRKESRLVHEIAVPSCVSEWNLGKGESEVIAFAVQDCRFTAVVDDRPARRCAESLGVFVQGTIALIVEAKRNGCIDSVGTLLMQLRSNGFRMSEFLYDVAVKLGGEA